MCLSFYCFVTFICHINNKINYINLLFNLINKMKKIKVWLNSYSSIWQIGSIIYLPAVDQIIEIIERTNMRWNSRNVNGKFFTMLLRRCHICPCHLTIACLLRNSCLERTLPAVHRWYAFPHLHLYALMIYRLSQWGTHISEHRGLTICVIHEWRAGRITHITKFLFSY